MNCPTGSDIERAAAILVGGGLVAFATETVYGLGANALDVKAVARIFEVKARPRFDPLIVHIADRNWLSPLVVEVPEAARRLIDRFWPGPLTLVFPKTNRVPDLVTAGLPTVAVRMPAHPTALDFLSRVEIPVAAPSANRFGKVSPTTAQHVVDQLGGDIDYVLDGGASIVGLESTVVDFSGDSPTLLRPGGLPLEKIQGVIGPVRLLDAANSTGSKAAGPDQADAQRAPGMLAQHYATQTPLVVAPCGSPLPNAARIGLLAFVPEFDLDGFAAVEVLSLQGDLAEAASNLFAAMHRLDALRLDVIIARGVPNIGLGRAINDRLARASHRGD